MKKETTPSLFILTKPCGIHPFNFEWIKYYASKMLGKRRGPEMVAQSLSRGLDEISVPHALNPFIFGFFGKKNVIMHVVGGAKTLKWALRLKQKGEIGTLIAGPAISVVPEDHHSILKNPLIDTIVCPSQWTKDLYSSIDPYYRTKTEVWPAGVNAAVRASGRKNGRGIVYFKFTASEIRAAITRELAERGIVHDTFEYGGFRQADYFSALEKADWLIYLSPSESQGIALQEAWIRDVPTLVWSPGIWKYQAGPGTRAYSWNDPLISAPYLDPQGGMPFAAATDFHDAFERFMKQLSSFTPRRYCMEKLTDRKSAERFLEIINRK